MNEENRQKLDTQRTFCVKTKLVKTAQEKKLSKVKSKALINEDHNLNVRPTFLKAVCHDAAAKRQSFEPRDKPVICDRVPIPNPY